MFKSKSDAYNYVQDEGEEFLDTVSTIKIGENAIYDMMKEIDQKTIADKVKIQGKLVDKKKTIIMIAHNSAKFDTYLTTTCPQLKFRRCIEKNGLMSLTVGGF